MFVYSNGYIYFSKYVGDGRAKVSTGIKISKPDENGIDFSRLKLSDQLAVARVKEAAFKYEESCAVLGEKTKKDVLEGIISRCLGRTSRKRQGFTDDFLKVVADMRSGELLKKKSNDKYSESTAKNMEISLACLQEFSKDTGIPLDYNIDSKWLNALKVWFIKKDYKKNSIATHGGNLRNFLGITHRAGKHSSLFHKSEEFSFSSERTDKIALTEQDILKLYSLKLAPESEKARDIFVLGCFIGLRPKDLKQINKYRVRDGKLEQLTSKTKFRTIIPLHPIAKEIIAKYGQQQLPVLKDTNMNMLLPGICKKAGFTDIHMITFTRGGQKIAEHQPKYKLVSRHTSRRSFATNAYNAGVPVRNILLITGHTTEQAFRRYLDLDKENNAEKLAEHPFFKGS